MRQNEEVRDRKAVPAARPSRARMSKERGLGPARPRFKSWLLGLLASRPLESHPTFMSLFVHLDGGLMMLSLKPC